MLLVIPAQLRADQPMWIKAALKRRDGWAALAWPPSVLNVPGTPPHGPTYGRRNAIHLGTEGCAGHQACEQEARGRGAFLKLMRLRRIDAQDGHATSIRKTPWLMHIRSRLGKDFLWRGHRVFFLEPGPRIVKRTIPVAIEKVRRAGEL